MIDIKETSAVVGLCALVVMTFAIITIAVIKVVGYEMLFDYTSTVHDVTTVDSGFSKRHTNKSYPILQRKRRKERQRSRNEPKISDNSTTRKIFCCQLNVYEFLDNFKLERMMTRMGIEKIKFSLPKAYSTNFLRNKSPLWFDKNHPHASVVADDIVVPMVKQILKQHNYVIGSGKKFSVAIIGDSTTAYCFDRRFNEPGSCMKWQLSEMVKTALGTDDIYVAFFSSSGASFCGSHGFLAQTLWVVQNEKIHGCYDALALIGGWNSKAIETTTPVRLEILSKLRQWSSTTSVQHVFA